MFDEYKKEMTRNSAKLIIITTITSLLIAVTSFIGRVYEIKSVNRHSMISDGAVSS